MFAILDIMRASIVVEKVEYVQSVGMALFKRPEERSNLSVFVIFFLPFYNFCKCGVLVCENYNLFRFVIVFHCALLCFFFSFFILISVANPFMFYLFKKHFLN